ncbi:MAG TPA: hypothetical protein PLD40_10555 [Kiritimatiellia bacterium]|nr:hypothetical protein [Kiritimatiellia bacterium]
MSVDSQRLSIPDDSVNTGARRGGISRWATQIAAGLPVWLGLCLALAVLASLTVPVWKYARAGDFTWLPGALLYGALFTGVAWWLAKVRPEREGQAVLALIGGSALLKLALVLLMGHLPLNTDQAIFRHFVETMADHRLAADTMDSLSADGDYSIWAGRAMPVHYLVRRLAGVHDALWMRLISIMVSSALLVMTAAFARRLLPANKRKWAVFLLVALPFQTFVVLDYGHHLLSSFYLLLGTWCVWELVHASPGLPRRLGLSVVAGLCLLLMMWLRGIHLIALGAWVGLLLWAAFQEKARRHWCRLVFWGILLPLGLASPLARHYDSWLRQHDAHQLNSMLPAFVARGWCPESAGEYCGRYEQIDRATPGPDQKSAMWRLVFSQIRYNPRVVCVRFPIIKTAKLFLVGYAANIEEALAMEKSPVLPWVRGMRLAAAPVFLLWACWGCFLLAVSPSPQRERWLAVFLVPLLTWGTYVFLGETSPRYSIYCQPFLGLIGAYALVARRGHEAGAPTESWRRPLLRGVVMLAVGAVVLGGLTYGIRQVPARYFYADLRQGWSRVGGPASSPVVAPGDFQPLEAKIQLPPGSDEARVEWQLPVPAGVPREVALYLLGADAGLSQAVLSIGTGAGPLFSLPLNELNRPRHLRIVVPAADDSLRFSLRKAMPPENRIPGTLQIGYLTCRPLPAAP